MQDLEPGPGTYDIGQSFGLDLCHTKSWNRSAVAVKPTVKLCKAANGPMVCEADNSSPRTSQNLLHLSSLSMVRPDSFQPDRSQNLIETATRCNGILNCWITPDAPVIPIDESFSISLTERLENVGNRGRVWRVSRSISMLYFVEVWWSFCWLWRPSFITCTFPFPLQGMVQDNDQQGAGWGEGSKCFSAIDLR